MIQFSIHRSELIHFGELKTESFSGLCRLNLENIFRLGGGGVVPFSGKILPDGLSLSVVAISHFGY